MGCGYTVIGILCCCNLGVKVSLEEEVTSV